MTTIPTKPPNVVSTIAHTYMVLEMPSKIVKHVDSAPAANFNSGGDNDDNVHSTASRNSETTADASQMKMQMPEILPPKDQIVVWSEAQQNWLQEREEKL